MAIYQTRQYYRDVGICLRRIVGWIIRDELTHQQLSKFAPMLRKIEGFTISGMVMMLEIRGYSTDLAQRAVWQCITKGYLLIDYNIGWRPNEYLKTITEAEHTRLNPIKDRRSAW